MKRRTINIEEAQKNTLRYRTILEGCLDAIEKDLGGKLTVEDRELLMLPFFRAVIDRVTLRAIESDLQDFNSDD